MSLLSLIAALLLEQLRPLQSRRFVGEPLAKCAGVLERNLNAGEQQQGVIAWLLAIVPVCLFTWFIYHLLYKANPLLALGWNVAILYLTLGFRQFSHYFTDIYLALQNGDIAQARQLLSQWRGRPSDILSSSDVARLSIEEALKASHHHVFGVLFWFVLLPGPTGALLYRLAAFLGRKWGAAQVVSEIPHLGASETDRFGLFARKAFFLIDWVPARLTAISFSVVGDFEDAIYCWRTQAAKWQSENPGEELGDNTGVILASGAGALGVKLGMPIAQHGEVVDRIELGLGDEADAAFMQSTIGLVWRALVLWLFLILLISLAHAV